MDKAWRLSKEQYYRKKEKFLKEEHEDEMDWSLKPRKTKEIMFRTLLTADPETEERYITFTYICEFSKLPEALIDDMMFVTSGLFSFDKWEWNDEIVSEVKDLIKKKKNDYLSEFIMISRGDWSHRHLYEHASKKVAQFKECLDDVPAIGDAFVKAMSFYYMAQQQAEKLYTRESDDVSLLSSYVGLFNTAFYELKQKGKVLNRLVNCDRKVKQRLDWRMIREKQNVSEEYLEEMKMYYERADV